MVERAHQPPVRYFLGVGQLEGAGCGVARVRERRVFVVLAFAVQGVERLVGHQNLAAYLEFFRIVPVELPGYIGDSQRVFGHVVTENAVTARQSLDQPAFPVAQADCRPVELQFAAVAEPGAVQRPFGPGGELLDFRDGVGVAQRQHGVAVPALHEACTGLRLGVAVEGGVKVGAHLPGGGVGAVEFRVFRLQAFELVHQRVELEVGDYGGVVDVISPAVLLERAAQLFDSFPGLVSVHKLQK